MKQFDSRRSEFSPYGFTCELWKPARMPRPDRHNEVELNLLASGSLTYLLGGRRTTIEAGKLAIFWAAIPHQIVDFQGDTPYFVVTLPLSEFLRIGVDTILMRRILQGELLIDSRSDSTDEMMFQRWERELRGSTPSLEKAAELEVHARLLRFAEGASNGRSAPPSPILSRADQLACYIARNYEQPLTSQSIADANGLHPNYAMNLFRKTFGTTIGSFVTQHRISHAQRLLVTTDDAILHIALSSGFQSLSRFNEAFKAACGCSPRGYRKEHHPTAGTQSLS
ncbi:MAG: helix-turn-helix domain-containing protein [Planctomycetaceae bacterium]|nr:helix-turn-helix domain-containing protein [Planctomycetaceae bacterium]MCB9939039.1 helix-turn-helix domain-containing protein [Planctomycetaceae bacterium]